MDWNFTLRNWNTFLNASWSSSAQVCGRSCTRWNCTVQSLWGGLLAGISKVSLYGEALHCYFLKNNCFTSIKDRDYIDIYKALVYVPWSIFYQDITLFIHYVTELQFFTFSHPRKPSCETEITLKLYNINII